MILKKLSIVFLVVLIGGSAVVAASPAEAEKGGVKKTNAFTLGAGGGIFYVNQTSWADVYNKANALYGVKIGWQFKEKIEIFTECDYMKASGEMEPIPDACSATIIPLYVGIRYIFKTGSLFHPHVGAAGVYGTLAEKGDFGEIDATGFGPSIQVGSYIRFSKRFGLDVVLKYDRLIFKNEKYDTESDMSGARLLLLFTYITK